MRFRCAVERKGEEGEKGGAVVGEMRRKKLRDAVDEDYRPKSSLTASVLVTKSTPWSGTFPRIPSLSLELK